MTLAPLALPRTRDLLVPRRIWLEPEAADLPRGREVLARFPDAQRIEVASHWDIPDLHGNEGSVERWVRVKTEDLVLGVKRSLTARPNGRSADFIAPSTANGCAMACAYCYVPRRKGYANPVTVFVNIQDVTRYLSRHVARRGVKPSPNQCDPAAWVYDIGENSDCSVDARICDNVKDLVGLFRSLPTAKASFATKHVNRDMLSWDPQGRTRVRFSLMPDDVARVLDVRTDRVSDRIAAIDDFVAAGYEVHLNLSPVVVRRGWVAEWAELLDQVNEGTSDAFKAQAAAEVIMLTHNEDLHRVNLSWHPRAEELLWRPDLQEEKTSQNGALNVRYRHAGKAQCLDALRALVRERAPWLRIRYAF